MRGNVALFLLFAITASVGTGVGVYFLIRDHVRESAAAGSQPATSRAHAPARPAASREHEVAAPQPAPPPTSRTDLLALAEAAAVNPVRPAGADSAAPRFGTPGVAGELSAREVARVVRSYARRFVRCVDKAIDDEVPVGGTLHVRFVIGGDGKVVSAEHAGSVDRRLANCTVAVIAKLEFPAPGDGNPVGVVFPIAFPEL